MHTRILTQLKFLTAGLLCLGLVLLVSIKGSVRAAIPNEYIANYDIKTSWEDILSTFVGIDAAVKVGSQIPASDFGKLNTNFQVLFSKFPQSYSFKVVYQQCSQLSQLLSQLSYDDPVYAGQLGKFMNYCYKPLTDILKTINSQYTITTKIKASPQTGPAPLAVTFDARGTTDPSNETVPSKNFYWYYRDTNGQDQVIGNGPVVSYTFEKEGNYLVHMTAKSSNRTSKGILDGDATVSVDVTPKTAVISIYANGQKMKEDTKAKIGTMEAQRGIVFDASATLAMGGRKIISYHWEITTKEGFKYTKDGDGKPDLIRVSLPDKGEYKITLDVYDNEANKTSESYALVASDPVAIVKQTPEKGNTSTTFSFDGNPSYSVLSSVKLYTWEIFDQDGVKLETYQGKDIKQKFKKPGFYTIKLTIEDQLGQTNIDSSQVYVESTEPIPQFLIQPTSERKYPSKFLLDATISSDIDKTNGYDDLSYDWIFPDEAQAKITNTENNNGKVTVEFNAIGSFICKLVVKDKFGKSSELEKTIEVKSILRPEITVSPQTTTWGTPMTFKVSANLPLLSYEWDFADGDTRTLQTDSITHLYQKTGIYKIQLKVNGDNNDSNEVTTNAFVGEQDYPIAAYEVKDKNNTILTQNTKCEESPTAGSGSTSPAYQIERYSDFNIDPKLSVNTKGEKKDLEFYFQPKNKEIYKDTAFKYKFDELGCQYIDLTAEDTSIGKNNITRIWFKVVNALPKIDNITTLFPQYGNEVGIGFNQNQVRDIFNSTFDPLIVKVTATMPVDPDGFISYFKRYYYLKDDPTRYIETKITPGDIPYVFFSLPRIAGEYSFGVTMYDNDEGRQASQDIIGNGPIVFFPPDASRPDVPLVTLKVNQSTVEVGDDVSFDVVSKIISDRPDFIKERTIYYDFDGDGTWDLITKKDHVTHVYTQPSEINGLRPRAAVLYRGYKGVSNGGILVVKNGLKPRLLVNSVGNFAIFRDISLGDITKKALCLDSKSCTDKTALSTGAAFAYEYPTIGKYFVSLDISDAYANEAKKRLVLTLTTGDTTQDFQLLSIPEATISKDSIEILVGNALDNTILFYIKHNENLGACYVDADINQDTNKDGNPANDQDFGCNSLQLQQYAGTYDNVTGRIYYSDRNGKLLSKDFKVGFIDFEANLDADSKKLYDQLSTLLKSMSDAQWLTGAGGNAKNMIVNLRDNIADKPLTISTIVTLKDYLSKNTLPFSKDQQGILNTVFLALSDKAITAAEGGNQYQILKTEILDTLPLNLKTEIDSLFTQFEAVAGDQTLQVTQQDKRKEALQKIIDRIKTYVAPDGQDPTANQIDKTDMNDIIMKDICEIMNIYSIPSATCNTTDTKAVPDNVTVENGAKTSTGNSRLKIVFIILGGLIGIFVVLVVIFAVKAKISQEKEDGEGTPQQPAG